MAQVRYPVILSTFEKEVARKVVLAFGQTMCGFDILRSGGNSFVCDVNGWASVKDSHKFWDDAANLLRQCVLTRARSRDDWALAVFAPMPSALLPHDCC